MGELATKPAGVPAAPKNKPKNPGQAKKGPKSFNGLELYGLPSPLEPFKEHQWWEIGGNRLRDLAGSRRKALGRFLFNRSTTPQRGAIIDCAEPKLANFLVAIRNPYCFDSSMQKMLENYDGWEIFHSSDHFDFLISDKSPTLEPHVLPLVQSALEDSYEKLTNAPQSLIAPNPREALLAPLIAPGFRKIHVVFDDLGSIRGDTVPNGPIRLNSSLLNSKDVQELFVKALCAHELFHRVQYSYGFRRLSPGQSTELPYVEENPFLYFSEGTASMIEAWLYETCTSPGKVQSLHTHPEIGMLRNSYSAMPFWFQFLANLREGRGSQYRVLETLLRFYGDSRGSGPLRDAISRSVETTNTRLNGEVWALPPTSSLDGIVLPTSLNEALAFYGRASVLGMNLKDSHAEGGPPIPLTVRVKPIAAPVTVHGVLQSHGMDIYLVNQAVHFLPGDEITVRSRALTSGRHLLFVQANGLATSYRLTLAPIGQAMGNLPAPNPIRAVHNTRLRASHELTNMGVNVKRDDSGNFLIGAANFTNLALGFEVAVPITNPTPTTGLDPSPAEFREVFRSISGIDPQHADWGNRDFLSCTAIGNVRNSWELEVAGNRPDWAGGPRLLKVDRSIEFRKTEIHVTTTLHLSMDPGEIRFAIATLTATVPAARWDGGDPPICEVRGGDCDPDTRPTVMELVAPLEGIEVLEPFQVCPGYIVAPYSVPYNGDGRPLVFIHKYTCKKFGSVVSLCPKHPETRPEKHPS